MWQITPADTSLEILCKTFEGLEEPLENEIRALGLEPVRHNRAVSVQGSYSDVLNLNFNLRTALNVMVKVADFVAHDTDELFKHAFEIDWPAFFDIRHTFAITYNVRSEDFRHSQFAALKLKDAITDRFKKKHFKRPSVDKENPDVVIHLSIFRNSVTIWFDTSGKPLYIRGYKRVNGPAPMNEVLAAGLVALSGWDRQQPLFNPMCGSGTLGFEAYMMANQIPPSFNRERFAYHALPWYDPTAEIALQKEINAAIKSTYEVQVKFSDLDEKAMHAVKKNAAAFAGMGTSMQFSCEDFFTAEPPFDEGMLLINPPYGERMEETDLVAFYRKMGDTFKHKYAGYTAWVISSALQEIKFLGLKPFRKIKVFNGPLEARWLGYKLYGFREK